MANLSDIASLIVASFDLSVVRGIRQAMFIADLTGIATAARAAKMDRYEPGLVVHPEPRIEPRRVYHPEPRFIARPVVPVDVSVRPALEPAATDPCYCEPSSTQAKSVIEPPWRTVPWENPMPARPVVKIVKRSPDVIRTGKLIDFYT